MIHHIYHIPERRKIGVATNVSNRMLRHEWTGFYEILECHVDPQIASDRERELQEQYGYEVDKNPYINTYKMNQEKDMTEYFRRLGISNRSLTIEQVERIKELKGSLSQAKIAKLIGTSQSTVHRIHANETYR